MLVHLRDFIDIGSPGSLTPVSGQGFLFYVHLTFEKYSWYTGNTSGRLEIASMLVLEGLRADCLSLVESSSQVLDYKVVQRGEALSLTQRSISTC